MPYAAANKDAAERAAETLNASPRIGGPTGDASGRTVTRYVVSKYASPNGKYGKGDPGGRYEYGVVERWTYNDRPDLGEFGGAFFDLTGYA